jgi:hypothetical protein
MATDQLYRVEATGYFVRALQAIKGPLTWHEAASHYTERCHAQLVSDGGGHPQSRT